MFFSQKDPCPASTRLEARPPACSHRRRDRRRRGAGQARPGGRGKHLGQGGTQKTKGKNRPATRRGGGRGGTTPFPANGRRTRGFSARVSTTGMWGSDSLTWIGRRSGEAGGRRWSRARRRKWRGGSGWSDSGEREGRGWSGSRQGARGGGVEVLCRRNRGGATRVERISGNKRTAVLRGCGSPGGGEGDFTEGRARLTLEGRAWLH
jgi:hypothetical protein